MASRTDPIYYIEVEWTWMMRQMRDEQLHFTNNTTDGLGCVRLSDYFQYPEHIL